MLVVFLMARVAVHRRILVPLILVTVFARHFNVFIAELVPSLVMVEPHLLPVFLAVTVRTNRSCLPFVLIVFLVASITIRWRITILDLGFVTCLALGLLRVRMCSLEGKVRPRVVECLFGNFSDILRTASVFCMALFAFPLFFESAVGALFGIDILPHVFVAIETETGLGSLVEPLVTLGAVFLPLGMTPDHLARHKGGFDIVGPGVIQGECPQRQGKGWNMAGESLHR